VSGPARDLPRDPVAAALGPDAAPVGKPYRFGLVHHNRLSLVGYGREMKQRLLAARRPAGPEPRKFLLFGRARSGTTLLARLLNMTPEIRCDGEMLHYAVLDPRGHLNRLARNAGSPVYGCKALSYQLLEVQRMADPAGFLRALAADGFRIVHITRDTLAQCVSLSTAQEVSRYHRSPQWAGNVARARIDPDRFVRQVRWNEALLTFERRLLDGLSHLSVNYDADLAEPAGHQALVDRLCAQIGARPGPVEATVRKLLPRELSATVEDFDTLLDRLRGAGLGAVIDAHDAMRARAQAAAQARAQTGTPTGAPTGTRVGVAAGTPAP
jgi:LPS sulfotransferase NodH